MSKSYAAGKSLLWFMIAYHALVGIVLLTSGELAIRLANTGFGWMVEGSPPLGILGEILGCFLITFAAMLFVITLDPVKYSVLLNVALVLIVLRVIQRIVFADKVIEVFKVPEARYWASCAFVALLGVGLFLFRRQLARDARAGS